MSRVRFHGIHSLSKISNVHWSGIGWKDFDDSLTVQNNINNMNMTFDIVMAYKPLEFKNFKGVIYPKCIRYNEMYDINWTLKEIKKSGAQLVVCHHLNDCKKYEKMNLPGVKFVYIGHCANKRIFKNYNLKKKYDISFVGIDNPSIYPVRHRLKQISLQLSNIYNVHFHPHPGYNLPDAYKDLYLIDMAKVINQSKIIISCSSKFKYRLGKYIEVPMSHSVLCADIPNDSDNYDYLIDFHNDMSDQEIMEIISYYLNNSDLLADKQLKGAEFAMNYTQDHYAERLLNEIFDFIK